MRFALCRYGKLLAAAQCVQDRFHAARYTQLVEYPKKMILHRVLTQLQSSGQIPVAESLCQQVENLLLALAKDGGAQRIGDA